MVTRPKEPVVEKKVEEVQAEEVETANTIFELPFEKRFQMLGAMIREKAGSTLKFDSTIENISYDYVDTQQYKVLLASCCDALGITFICSFGDTQVQMERDNKGVMVYMAQTKLVVEFLDDDGSTHATRHMTADGFGVSRNGSVVTIAQTNAIRGFITNNFLLPTNDRDFDDVKSNMKAETFFTDSQKAEKREKLLNATKSTAEYANIKYGEILYARAMETMDKMPEDFKKKLNHFIEKNYEDGKPIPLEGSDNLWKVKKTAANAVLGDIDQYA